MLSYLGSFDKARIRLRRIEKMSKTKENKEIELDKRPEKVQILLAEMREVVDSKTASVIFDALENGWSEETLLRTKVSILILRELERIRTALEDPYHVKHDLEREKQSEVLK